MKRYSVLKKCAIAVFLISAIVYIFVFFSGERTSGVQDEQNVNWSSGWIVSSTETDGLVLPYSEYALLGEKLTLRKQLPNEIESGTKLYIKTNYQKITYYVGGNEVEAEGNEVAFWAKNANQWTAISLCAEDAGKLIELEVTSSGSKLKIEVLRALIGSRDDIEFSILSRDLAKYIVCVFLFCVSIFLVILSVIVKLRYKEERVGFWMLAIFVFLSTAWVLVDSDVQAVVCINSKSLFLLNYCAYALMPVAFSLYCAVTSVKNRARFYLASALLLVYYIISSVLLFLGVLPLYFALSLSHLILAFAIILLLITLAKEVIRYKNNSLFELFIGFIVLIPFGVFQIFDFYFLSSRQNNTEYFVIGVAVFIIILAIGAILRAMGVLETSRSFTSLAESVPAGICRISLAPEIKVTYANASFYKMFGFTEDEAKKNNVTPLEIMLHSDEIGDIVYYVEEAVKSGNDYFDMEFAQLNKSGELMWIVANCHIDGANRITASLNDVTENKLTTEKLNLLEEERRILSADSKKMIVRYNADSKIAYLSQEAMRFFDKPKKLVGVPYSVIEKGEISNADVIDYLSFYDKINDGKREGETIVSRKTGDCFTRVKLCFRNIFGSDGKVKLTVISVERMDE